MNRRCPWAPLKDEASITADKGRLLVTEHQPSRLWVGLISDGGFITLLSVLPLRYMDSYIVRVTEVKLLLLLSVHCSKNGHAADKAHQWNCLDSCDLEPFFSLQQIHLSKRQYSSTENIFLKDKAQDNDDSKQILRNTEFP